MPKFQPRTKKLNIEGMILREEIAKNIKGNKKVWGEPKYKQERSYMSISRIYPFQEKQPIFKSIFKSLNVNPKDRVLVLAGYRGNFSNALQKIGLEVINTDLVRAHAKEIKHMPSFEFAAHEIPKVSRVKLYLSFEAIPAYRDIPGFITLLKAMAHTELGLMDFHTLYGTYTSPQNIFIAFGKIYNCEVKQVVRDDVVGLYLSNAKAKKAEIKEDLEYMTAILNDNIEHLDPRKIDALMNKLRDFLAVANRRNL